MHAPARGRKEKMIAYTLWAIMLFVYSWKVDLFVTSNPLCGSVGMERLSAWETKKGYLYIPTHSFSMQNSQEVQRYSGDYYVVQNPIPMQTAPQPVPSDSVLSYIGTTASNYSPSTHRDSSRHCSHITRAIDRTQGVRRSRPIH